MGVIQIVEGLEKNTSLKELNLRSAFLTLLSSGVSCVDEELHLISVISVISVIYISVIDMELMNDIVCKIGAEGARRMGEMLAMNASLQKLNLHGESFLFHYDHMHDHMCLNSRCSLRPWGSDQL